MESLNKFSLIAPCGMNCGICMAYLRNKNKCSGCRGVDTNKPITRTKCKIKNCLIFQKDKAKFYFECEKFQPVRLGLANFSNELSIKAKKISN